MSKIETGTIIKNSQILDSIYKMTLLLPKIAKSAHAGQFIQIYLDQKNLVLPRPISISSIKDHSLVIIFRIIGKGTALLSTFTVGSKITVLGPLGNGFSIPHNIKRSLIIGGGLGIAPLIELNNSITTRKDVYLGYSDTPFLLPEFHSPLSKIHIATMNGAIGFRGSVLDLLAAKAPKADIAFACGPKKMLSAVSVWAKRVNIPLQVSLEERMACGLGSCLGCAVKIKQEYHDDWNYSRVCKDGPVFNGDEVVWDDE